ncbi:MAG TPA: chalcone isomerase family protein [Acetobacteraceae bacterium]
MNRRTALPACLALMGLSLGLLPLQPAQAASLGGATLPDTYSAGGQTLVLNGIGLRTLTVFNVKVYAAALYLPKKSGDAQAIMASPGAKVILMQFLHAASKSQIEKQYREGEAKNCGHGECAQSDAGDFEKLIAATPAAAVGDTLTYVLSPRGVRVLFNNRVIGDFANPDLGLRLLAGFIGSAPPSEDLKRRLLGQSG